jgi:subtilisin family serine protease
MRSVGLDPILPPDPVETYALTSPVEGLLLAALQRGGSALVTGRHLLTFAGGSADAAIHQLQGYGLAGVEGREFPDPQQAQQASVGVDYLYFSALNIALVSGAGFQRLHAAGVMVNGADRGLIQAIEPESFLFASNGSSLRGFARAVQAIAESGAPQAYRALDDPAAPATEFGSTWGLQVTGVDTSPYGGEQIKVAILDTGLALAHPDFTQRAVVGASFVGEALEDRNGHGTHICGTACGPLLPAAGGRRFGIAHQSLLHIGKVLSNSGGGTTATVLAGIDWALRRGCQVISLAMAAQIPQQAAFTAAGTAALHQGSLIVAPVGGQGAATSAPANSPTILAVASLDPSLEPSGFSNRGKVDLAAPGWQVDFTSAPAGPQGLMGGTSMAAAHVAGCAALWAQQNPQLRGMKLWRQLQHSARRLPFAAEQVGAGLVQAP